MEGILLSKPCLFMSEIKNLGCIIFGPPPSLFASLSLVIAFKLKKTKLKQKGQGQCYATAKIKVIYQGQICQAIKHGHTEEYLFHNHISFIF